MPLISEVKSMLPIEDIKRYLDLFPLKEFEDGTDISGADWIYLTNMKFRRCPRSKKIIWPFTKAYWGIKHIAVFHYPKQMRISDNATTWICKEEYLFCKLKGLLE